MVDRCSMGLSPLARGNPLDARQPLGACGPIPARTGQPSPPVPPSAAPRAYPRSHGATGWASFFNAAVKGLSPLARGNPGQRRIGKRPHGPIPARTGQPRISRQKRLRCRAYPRSHGATLSSSSTPTRIRGLSPLARGNQFPMFAHNYDTGPIPARTGQPVYHHLAHMHIGAYPRSHGATEGSLAGQLKGAGLSPLARGNPGQIKWYEGLRGPIPARTGQPPITSSCPIGNRAYPRSHGATLGR